MTPTHYCTYCDYYSRTYGGANDGRPDSANDGSEVFTGTRAEVIAHADLHPAGDPEDMAQLLSERAPYGPRY